MDGSEIFKMFEEDTQNNNTINWDYWANLSDITPAQAAKLVYQINPIDLPDTGYCEQTPLFDNTLCEKIARLESWLESHSLSWSLADLAPALGESLAPWDMSNAVRNITPAVTKVKVLCDYVSFMQMESTINLVSKGLNKHLDHFTIAELWSIAGGQRIRNNIMNYLDRISQAVVDGDLVAELSILNSKVLGGYEVIPSSPTLLNQVKNGWVIDDEDDENDTWFQYTIHRDNFRIWLQKSNEWPIPDDCLLVKWFEYDPEVKSPNKKVLAGKTKTGANRKTALNEWLRTKWDMWGKPNAKDFAAKLKPLANTFGSPVDKYHSWNPEVVVEWKSEWGGGSWGNRSFANKVDDFKRDDKLAEAKKLSRE
jgi:hypothetical protein